ncbi:MAG: DUF4160 domain-containing protein [Rhizomicrobium sp.]
MPTLQDFGNWQIRMYFKDHNPPHIRVVSPDETALVRISDGAVIRGDIDGAVLKRAQAWVAEHRAELFAKWTEFQK